MLLTYAEMREMLLRPLQENIPATQTPQTQARDAANSLIDAVIEFCQAHADDRATWPLLRLAARLSRALAVGDLK